MGLLKIPQMEMHSTLQKNRTLLKTDSPIESGTADGFASISIFPTIHDVDTLVYM